MIDEVRQHLFARPFRPFAIVMSSGQRYQVPTAEHAALNPQGTQVVVWLDSGASQVLAGDHMNSVEQVFQPNPKQGRRKKK